ncbi:MAG: nucleoside kinase [Lachnospiraceae bacterium]|nr:nucleoside kinase [Lachnospiraceae bacterium]
MGEKVTLTVNGVAKEYDKGISYETVAAGYKGDFKADIAVACLNGKLKELFKKVDEDGTLEFYDMTHPIGHRTYMRTATLIFIKAANDVIGMNKIRKLKMEFSLGTGYFFSCEGDFTVDDELCGKIQAGMKKIVEADIPIMKSTFPLAKAVEVFKAQGMEDKEKLCKYRRSSVINVYELDGYYDYYYGHMLPRTSYVKAFEVLSYKGGFILNLPPAKTPEEIKTFVPLNHLFDTMMSATRLGDKLGIQCVGDLNECICEGDLGEMMLVAEALQERRVAEIAKDIVDRGGVKFVMIAGPSSSGKTSFSHRLSVQLRTLGLRPHPIGVDDYFVNREDTPKDEDGNFNFECLEAIDLELFNSDMKRLLNGETVEIPTFNFKSGHREYKGHYEHLGPEDILVIEGIHALNDKMSSSLPAESKFKVYISALTTLNIDEHNRIPTTDARMLRRMVRDFRTRGNSAKRTIQMWPSVRKGEEENIFPFQESADAMFNSALIFELAALKPFAEPLLYSIKPDEPEYLEARRLLKFLEYFLSMDTSNLPNNSICREFVGGSCFNV